MGGEGLDEGEGLDKEVGLVMDGGGRVGFLILAGRGPKERGGWVLVEDLGLRRVGGIFGVWRW